MFSVGFCLELGKVCKDINTYRVPREMFEQLPRDPAYVNA